MKVEKTNDIVLPDEKDVKPVVPEHLRSEDVPKYEGLQGSTQTFHALGHFEAIDGLVFLRVPDEIKKINPRKYRDQIFKVPEAIDKYINMGMVRLRLKEFGAKGYDELGDALDEFGAKIVEAIEQHRKINVHITDKMLMFKQKYLDYKRKSELLSTDRQLDSVT